MTQEQYSKLQAEFTEAFRSFERQLSRYSISKLSNAELAADLVQDTYLKTWNYLIKGGKINSMKPFLYHVLNHLIIDEYRRSRPTSLDNLVEKGFEPANEDFDRMINTLDGSVCTQLIKKLPENYRKILSMRFVENLSIDEIAKMSRQSKNNIAVQIHRGLKKLRSLTFQPVSKMA